jgi:hypothetical protein
MKKINELKEWVKEKFKKKEKASSLIYLNQPICDTNSDWIGMSVYVNKIDVAIQNGAQMIAITSDYGGGKSSLIELLEVKYKPSRKSKKKIFKISLWGFLNGEEKHVDSESKSIDLHKSFLYQIGNNINPNLGAYISRRLSKNFGLFKVGTSSPRFTLLISILLFFVALGKGIDLFSNKILEHFEWTKGYLYPSTLLFYFAALLIGIFLFISADIIFSTQKSENNRNIDENEIMDLYSTLIVKHRKLPIFKQCYKHYIIVLEDLDRTDIIDDVYIFLKELRKYYASDNMSKRKHKVTFIVNLKNEELLINDETKNEEIYQKIFDYTINLRPVNIDNYDVILKGLLQEKIDLISNLGLQIKIDDDIVRFPGMQWMIRSPHLNIREIKNMLNSAFLLYESLLNKFGNEKISFEKCAIVAYITNTYPSEFIKMKDRTFQDLIEKYISNKISDINSLGEFLKETFKFEFSKAYISDIHLLIENQLIDSTYRTYFYNYPRNSLLLDTNENLVYNTLLYNDDFDDAFEEQLLKVHLNNSKLIINALEKVKSLSISLPKVVLNNKIIFIEAISHFPKELIDLIAVNLKFDSSEISRTVETLKRILNYDSDRKYYDASFAKKLCDLIENQCSENLMVQIRIMLCKEFFNEILWYKSLFLGSHALISRDEMNFIHDISYIISLINLESNDFNISIVNELTEIIETKKLNEHEMEIIEDFYDISLNFLEEVELVPELIRYMKAVNKIIARFEDIIVTIIESNDIYLSSYNDLINQVSHISVTEQTIRYLNILKLYNNYLTLEVINKQYELGYILDYIYASINNDIYINFSDENIILTIKNNCENIFNEYPTIWGRIRLSILQSFINNIDSYRFMFNEKYPIINNEELTSINDLEQALSLINIQLIDDAHCDTLAKYFNRFEKLRNAEIYSLFRFVLKLDDEYGYKLFYSIDPNIIPLNRLSKKNKKELIISFNAMLNLDDSKGIIKFMLFTNELNETLEKKLWELIKEDADIQNEYVKIINSINKPTPITLNNITKLNNIPIVTPQINEKLYEYGKYTHYVSSKVRKEKKFIIEEDKLDVLWNVYKDFMKSTGYLSTREIMTKNNDFMRRLVDEKVYIGLPKANLIHFAKIPQTVDMLESLLLYDNDFQEEYLSVIVGFADKETASRFLSIIENNESLMISQSIYDNTYEKLIDSGLKYRYTRKRGIIKSQI